MGYFNHDRKYNINISADPEIENPKLTHINRLPARTTVIPALHRGVYYRNKEESEFITSLNGAYRFCWEQYDSKPDFYGIHYDDSLWDTLEVPSMWQYHGYGKPEYPNVWYSIPFNPPYISYENPVGYYRRHLCFTPKNENGRQILHFDGVDNAYFVYLNGKEVGMSKGSRMPAEFDVTDKIVSGDNLLAVKVFTRSDASYLENQDMLLASGIFRDVYLIDMPTVSVWDYEIIPDLKGIELAVTLNEKGDGYSVSAEMDSVKAVASADSEIVKLRLEPENPVLWNAENPYLYDLTIKLYHCGEIVEIHSKRIGLRTVETVGSRLLVNGMPITIKGVNRHEHNPKNGRAVSIEQIEKELKIIKKNNINAIRCSHYPNNPAFYEIASELGIYVADEADIESHGCDAIGDQGYLSKSPLWRSAYIDRTVRMAERDKNETCVIIWSIGNECGQGKNIEECAKYLRGFKVRKPILQAQDDAYNPVFSDFRQNGYCPLSVLDTYPADGEPVILTEYAHSMGNSPGGLADYWKKIYHTDWFIGGFIWELKNHGFYSKGKDGKARYLYGGDFGDYNHYSNFTLDGLLFSDGREKPAMREVFQVYSPVWVEYRDGIKLMNTMDFTDLSELTVKWELLEDYNILKSGNMRAPKASPHTEVEFDPGYGYFEPVPGAEYYVNLEFFKNGKSVGISQIKLPIKNAKVKPSELCFDGNITVGNGKLTVNLKDSSIVFSGGLIETYKYKGRNLPVSNMKMSFYRAPTDNDGLVGLRAGHAGDWDWCFLNHITFSCEKIKTEKTENALRITAEGKTMPPARFAGFETVLIYDIYSDGKIFIEITGKPYGCLPGVLPRIGVSFEADGKYNRVEWYGRGQQENYSDRKLSAIMGLYSSDISELNTVYDVPQETGNREDVAFLNVTDGANFGIAVIGSPRFAFSYHDFTLENLTKARHCDELNYSDKNYLYIDYRMRPLGSYSCGPEPEEMYELHPHTYRFCFTLMPYASSESSLELARQQARAQNEALSDTFTANVSERIPQNFNCF